MAVLVVQNILKEPDILNHWPPKEGQKRYIKSFLIYCILNYYECKVKELGKRQKGNTSLEPLKSED